MTYANNVCWYNCLRFRSLLVECFFDGNKDVRKKFYQTPTFKVSLFRLATLDIVLSKAKELYFGEFNVSLEAMSLCDSSVIIIPADKNSVVAKLVEICLYT